MDKDIEEKVEVHDRFQFEIKQSYRYSTKRKSNDFHVETYIFIPRNLNVNRDTYSRDDFYKDLKTNIRIKTPSVSLQTLSSNEEFIKRIRESIERLQKSPGKKAADNYEYHIKMFTLIYKKALWLQVRFIQDTELESDVIRLIDEFLESTADISQQFRELRNYIITPTVPGEHRSLYLFADEYISLKIQSKAFKLLQCLENKKLKGKKSYSRKVLQLIHSENDYRQKNGYPSIIQEDSSNEDFIYRQGILKKVLSNVLYLESHIEKDGKVIEQVVYSLAAGLAMVFATTVAFIGQTKYGNLTLPFFIALVISYMFKDRLKELIRIYFNVKRFNFLHDRRRKLFRSFKKAIGLCKESFNFISENKVPAEVIQQRERDVMTDIDNSLLGEDIILYTKDIHLSSKRFNEISEKYTTEGIIDVTRFNIENFLRNMDNPTKKVFLAEKNGYRELQGRRSYHINILIWYRIDEVDYINRFRLVLNRKGIMRIEEVA